MVRTKSINKWLLATMVTVVTVLGLWLSASVQAEENSAGENRQEVGETANVAAKLEAVPPVVEPNARLERVSSPEDARQLVQVRGESVLADDADLYGLNGMQIASGSMFSFRNLIGEASGDDWSYLASLLHEAAVKAGLGIAERHIGLVMTEGATPGFEAMLDGTSRDLQLYNDLSFDVWVEAGADAQGRPEIRLVGEPPDDWQAPVIRVETERFAPDIMILVNEDPSKAYRPSWTSREGLLAKVYRIEDGERVLLYKDFYPAMPRVEIR